MLSAASNRNSFKKNGMCHLKITVQQLRDRTEDPDAFLLSFPKTSVCWLFHCFPPSGPKDGYGHHALRQKYLLSTLSSEGEAFSEALPEDIPHISVARTVCMPMLTQLVARKRNHQDECKLLKTGPLGLRRNPTSSEVYGCPIPT